jgi:hypothetical protein
VDNLGHLVSSRCNICQIIDNSGTLSQRQKRARLPAGLLAAILPSQSALECAIGHCRFCRKIGNPWWHTLFVFEGGDRSSELEDDPYTSDRQASIPRPPSLRALYEGRHYQAAEFRSSDSAIGTVPNIVRWLCAPPGGIAGNQYFELPGAWGGIWVMPCVLEQAGQRAVVRIDAAHELPVDASNCSKRYPLDGLVLLVIEQEDPEIIDGYLREWVSFDIRFRAYLWLASAVWDRLKINLQPGNFLPGEPQGLVKLGFANQQQPAAGGSNANVETRGGTDVLYDDAYDELKRDPGFSGLQLSGKKGKTWDWAKLASFQPAFDSYFSQLLSVNLLLRDTERDRAASMQRFRKAMNDRRHKGK